MILLWILILVVSLLAIVKASDYFTDASERLGHILKLNMFFIGITIVALGTSLPELAISILSVTNNSSEIVISNVVGSNIFNILIIAGVAFLLSKHFEIKKKWSYLYLTLSATFIVITSVFFGDQKFLYYEGIVGIVVFCAYLIFIQAVRKDRDLHEIFNFRRPPLFAERSHGHGRSMGVIIISLVVIYFGAWAIIQSIINIADTLNIEKAIIAVTAVAIGTSLPELLVTFSAVKKKSYDLIVGNIAGSNMINAFLVLGVPSLIKPLNIPFSIIEIGMPFLLYSTLLIAIFGLLGYTKRWLGLVFLITYMLFILII